MDGIFKRTWFLTEEEGGREGSHFHPQQPPDGLLLAAESTAKIGEWSLKSLGEKNECLGNSFVVSGVLTKKSIFIAYGERLECGRGATQPRGASIFSSPFDTFTVSKQNIIIMHCLASVYRFRVYCLIWVTWHMQK